MYYYAKSGLPTVQDKLRENVVRRTCESVLMSVLYPRSSIVVQIFEMEDSGGVSFVLIDVSIKSSVNFLFMFFFCRQLLACAMNAVCLALLNSGLSMKMLLAAVHCVIDEQGELVLDPDRSVCENAQASLTFVFDSTDKNLIATYTTGRFAIGQYNDAVNQCRQASATIFQFYRDAIRKFNKNV